MTLGHAVAYVPASAAAQFRSAGLAVVPVRDLSPSQVMVAWPDTSRSAAVAAFVRAALEAAASEITASEAAASEAAASEAAASEAAAEPAQAAHAPGAL